MKKIIFIIMAMLVLSGCSVTQANIEESEVVNSSENKKITLGFCPTMEFKAENFQKNNENVEIIPLASASEVLESLLVGNIDLALIGRKAELSEVSADTLEHQLFTQGFTLVFSEKAIISLDELKDLKIKTCLDEDLVKSNFSNWQNIIFETSSDCYPDNKDVWLIAWEDWTDNMSLLIPIDDYGNKVEKYRSPFLYGKNFDNLNF